LLKIVAEPNLVCVSGRPAFFNVGGEFPIIVPQSLGTVSVQYKKFGTQLDFVPIVLGNNRIRLEVRPRVSEIDPARGVFINGQQVPGLRVREVETGVEMRAGETLAIAGLLQQRTEMRKRGIPFLSDMPVVGVVFRSVKSEVNEIETLILVTPQFVEAMDVCEVPPGGPGLQSCPPNHCQLYCGGLVEVPCCNNGYQTEIPGFGAAAGQGFGPGSGVMMERSDLIGPPPRTPAEPVPAPPKSAPVPNGGPTIGPELGTTPSAARRSMPGAASVRTTTHSVGQPPALQAQYIVPDVKPRGGTASASEEPFKPDMLKDPASRTRGTIPSPGMIGPSGYQLKN
jgi:pilus assembly protein CpaC